MQRFHFDFAVDVLSGATSSGKKRVDTAPLGTAVFRLSLLTHPAGVKSRGFTSPVANSTPQEDIGRGNVPLTRDRLRKERTQ